MKEKPLELLDLVSSGWTSANGEALRGLSCRQVTFPGTRNRVSSTWGERKTLCVEGPGCGDREKAALGLSKTSRLLSGSADVLANLVSWCAKAVSLSALLRIGSALDESCHLSLPCPLPVLLEPIGRSTWSPSAGPNNRESNHFRSMHVCGAPYVMIDRNFGILSARCHSLFSPPDRTGSGISTASFRHPYWTLWCDFCVKSVLPVVWYRNGMWVALLGIRGVPALELGNQAVIRPLVLGPTVLSLCSHRAPRC